MFFLYNQYTRATSDTTAPIIKCSEDTITTSVAVTEEELLKGVTAFGETCGDISDTIVIEKISDFIADNERVITYVAVDDSMNVGRYERTLIYNDYKPSTFTLNAPLSYTVGTKINILKDVGAQSVIDGDISNKVRYGLEQGYGLYEYLNEEISLSEYIDSAKAENPYTTENFTFLPGGKAIADGSTILFSERMEQLLNYIQEQADYVIIDSAPTGILTDSATIAKYVDAGILVIKQDYATIDIINDALSHLSESDISIIGGVLNEA